MTPTTNTTGFRLPPDLIERLDLYAERLARETGVPVNRTDAVRKLLVEALDRVQPDTVRDAAMDERDAHRYRARVEAKRKNKK